MDVTKESVEEFYNGHATVGLTRVKLTGTLSFPLNKGILLRCPGGTDPNPNSDPIWVGGAGVTADSAAGSGGMPMIPGDVLFIPIDRSDKLWVISTDTDQDIAWMGI